jgi:predicted extracellular nuclease
MKTTRFMAAAALMCVSLAGLVVLLALLGTGTTAAAPAAAQRIQAAPGDILINEFVPKGTEWIELYNPTTATVSLAGWTLSNVGGTDSLTGSIPAGGYLVTPTLNIGLDNSGDEIVLRDEFGTVIDMVVYGTMGGAPIAPQYDSTARTPNGQDTESNANDWTIDPTPTEGAANDAAGISLGSSLLINEFNDYPPPASDAIEFYNPLGVSVPITGWMISDGDDLAVISSTDQVPAGGWLVINPNDYGVSPTSGDVLYIFDPDGTRVDQIGWYSEYEDYTFQRIPDGAGPNDGYGWVSSGGGVTWFDLPETLGAKNTGLAIHHIQGAAQYSPMEGLAVRDIGGIVTVVRYNGFYMQDPIGDHDPATSEAIYVYTGASPGVAVGDAVTVDATVDEYYPGGFSAGNLPTTELVNPTVAVVSSGNLLPAPTVVGTGGRVPPVQIIENDSVGPVTTGVFDPDEDGIDFYESMEAMLLQVNDALVVGSTNFYGEITVVGDNGANARLLTPRGGLVLRSDDFNPERIILDDTIVAPAPELPVGSVFTAPITGVLDYSYGNYKLFNVESLPPAVGSLISETALAPVQYELRVASFNLLNLDPNAGDGDDDTARFAGLADQIVNHLLSPDIIGVQEVQDNSGETDNGVVDASETFTTLIAAIESAGGPTYEYRQINPLNNEDGGAPGSNIRVGFLFRTDRGLEFVDRPGGDATTPVAVVTGATGVELSISPGRIDPESPAWLESRKPLAGEFVFNGHKIFAVVAHFNSKSGDDPLFGWIQPPVFWSEEQRIGQAQKVNDFVDAVLALDADANVIVLGDLNDFQFSTPISDVLAADVLIDLVTTLPITEQYTYLYDGNSEVLDHILLIQDFYQRADVEFDAVHVNAEFAATDLRPSDHDPVVAVITFAGKLYLPIVNKDF